MHKIKLKKQRKHADEHSQQKNEALNLKSGHEAWKRTRIPRRENKSKEIVFQAKGKHSPQPKWSGFAPSEHGACQGKGGALMKLPKVLQKARCSLWKYLPAVTGPFGYTSALCWKK